MIGSTQMKPNSVIVTVFILSLTIMHQRNVQPPLTVIKASKPDKSHNLLSLLSLYCMPSKQQVCFIFLGTAVKDTVYRFVVKLHTQCSAFISLHLVCLMHLSCLHMYHLDMLLMCSHNFYRNVSTFSGYFPYKCCNIV